jgi:peroxiredoxin
MEGHTRLIATSSPPHLTIPEPGDAAPDAEVQTLNGDTVHLSVLWSTADRGLALIFLRHFGCPFCKEHAHDVDARTSAFRAAGLAVAFVGCGTADEARAFRDDLRLKNPVFIDPTRTAYRAYGLEVANAAAVFNPRVVAGSVRAAVKGYLPRKSSGNPLQLQGQFLIGWNGVIKTLSRPTMMSDIPDSSDLLADAMSLPWR